jgi:O-antigen/teichoic acid export membrane protein
MVGPMLLVPGVFLSVFGPGFEAGALALSVFALGQLFHVTLGLLEGVLQVTGFAYSMLVNSMVLVAGNTALLLLWVPKWGLLGAAIASTASFVGVTAWRLVQGRRLLRIWPFDRSQVKPLVSFAIATALAAGVVAWLHPVSFASRAAVAMFFLASYALGILLFRLEETDRDVIGAVRSRISRRRGPG